MMRIEHAMAMLETMVSMNGVKQGSDRTRDDDGRCSTECSCLPSETVAIAIDVNSHSLGRTPLRHVRFVQVSEGFEPLVQSTMGLHFVRPVPPQASQGRSPWYRGWGPRCDGAEEYPF